MITGRPPIPGLLVFLLAATTACSSSAPPPAETAAAVPGYTSPPGAPDICARLAGSTHFVGIPQAAGRLAAGTQVVEARTALAAARRELRAIVAELPDGEAAELRGATEAVVAALLGVLDEPLTQQAREALLDGMDDLVAELEPACGFPA
ncbi:hypothetical protein [Blastococcus xanthinilyticus]|uniref:Uncharacterized protein n=1 Tax=Blastococcus xanthinilyticus TaxID=1564164 RepID=A0A5S5CT35_9ACTN|nr:hypothetical protein [Blastococcus xanthinilyticus]TYP86883.1 hypothetical protein BD833_108168 [Blastococcus xanthinilyticus]